ncbi:MAG: peptidase M23 [Crocinitomicaceae bacterium]|nr:peptidase M23 [Crocinitomicaceae bacterium]
MSSEEKVEDSKVQVENAQEDLDEAKRQQAESYAQFKLEADQQITANEQLIADLKLYSKNKKAEVKAGYDKSISDLEAKNEVLKQRVATQKELNKEKWESFKSEFKRDMDELGKSIRDLGKDNVK